MRTECSDAQLTVSRLPAQISHHSLEYRDGRRVLCGFDTEHQRLPIGRNQIKEPREFLCAELGQCHPCAAGDPAELLQIRNLSSGGPVASDERPDSSIDLRLTDRALVYHIHDLPVSTREVAQ